MAITVSCECGKKLKVKEELAGKKVRCPECQATMVVPSAEAEEDVGIVAAPPPRKSPAAEEEGVQAAPPRKRARAEDDDEPPPRKHPRDDDGPPRKKGRADADLDDEDAPRKKRRHPNDEEDDRDASPPRKKTSVARMVWLISLGVVLVVVATIFAFMYLFKSPAKTIIGRWELDVEATRKEAAGMEVVFRGFQIEFREDESAFMTGLGQAFYKVARTEGNTVMVNLANNRGALEQVEIDVVNSNQIRLVFKEKGKDAGFIVLKRAAGAASIRAPEVYCEAAAPVVLCITSVL